MKKNNASRRISNILLMKHHYLNSDGKVRIDDGHRLSRALNIRLLDMTKELPIPPVASTVINWGSSSFKGRTPNVGQRIINHPLAVQKAIRKDVCLSILKEADVPCVEILDSLADVAEILNGERENAIVIGRKTVTGSGGEGIVLLNRGNFQDEAKNCKLFTKYFNKFYEFRVHVFKNEGGEYEVIDYTQKRHRRGEEADTKVRSYANGWIFTRDGAVHSDYVKKIAIDAVEALELDFGAVDVLAKRSIANGSNEAVVCEVNTSPGLDGDTTFSSYVEAFKKLLGI